MLREEREGVNKYSFPFLLILFIKGNEILGSLTCKTLIQRQNTKACGLVPVSANVFTEIKGLTIPEPENGRFFKYNMKEFEVIFTYFIDDENFHPFFIKQ